MLVKINDSLVGDYYIFVSHVGRENRTIVPEDLPEPKNDLIPVLAGSSILKGLRHIAVAASVTLYHRMKRRSKFRDPSVEMVVRLAGERQVSTALKAAMGGEPCLILVSRSAESIEEYLTLLKSRGVVLEGECRFSEPELPDGSGCGSGEDECLELTVVSQCAVSLYEK